MMWDIRYLLMGSKMGKLPGFPSDLSDVREKFIFPGMEILREREELGEFEVECRMLLVMFWSLDPLALWSVGDIWL